MRSKTVKLISVLLVMFMLVCAAPLLHSAPGTIGKLRDLPDEVRAFFGDVRSGRRETIELYGQAVRLHYQDLRENDMRTGAVLILSDLGEQQRADRMRYEFTANVSHELKTPLTSISGYAEMIENGMARDMNDAFERLLNKNKPFFIPRQFLPIERSIEIIREAGGTAVLAHPFQYRLDDAALRELIEHCMESGLEGMECRYSGYDAAQTAYLEALAAEYGLVRTGGSDFHGAIKGEIRLGEGKGGLNVPYAFLEELRSRRAKT